MSRSPVPALLAASLALSGCPGLSGDRLTTVDFQGPDARDGIDASRMVDGWSVNFTSFAVSISELDVVDTEGEPLLSLAGWKVELANPSDRNTFGAYTRPDDVGGVTFRVGPGGPVYFEGGSDADETDDDASVIVAGTATRGTEEKTFRWRFTTASRYADCGADFESTRLELVFAADHLFFRDLTQDSRTASFAALAAADSDGDGEVTTEELEAAAPPPEYVLGSTGVTTLWEALAHQAARLAHLPNHVHCGQVTPES